MRAFKTTLIIAASITVLYVHSNYIVYHVKNTRDSLHERIDVLVRDSVRKGDMIENFKLNYQDLKNLEK